MGASVAAMPAGAGSRANGFTTKANMILTGDTAAYRTPNSDHSVDPGVFPLRYGNRSPNVNWLVADALLGVGLLGGVMTLGNLRHMPQGLEAFLEIRLSVKDVLLLGTFGLFWPGVLMACGLYSPARLRTGNGELGRLVFAGAIGCVMALVFPLTSRSGLVTSWHAALFGALAVPATGFIRSAARAVHRHRWHEHRKHIMLVGSGPLAAALYQQLVAGTSARSIVVGFVDSKPQNALNGIRTPYLGAIHDLERILMHRVVDEVLVGLPVKSCYDDIQRTLAACSRVGIPASYPTNIFGNGTTHRVASGNVCPMFTLTPMPSTELLAIKRAMDIAGALVLLLLLAPLMLAIAAAIKVTSGGPVLYCQDRHGYMKRLFRMYKFRTMCPDADVRHAELEGDNEASGPAFKIRNDPRVTRLGRILRRTSLDELPQLWHVLVGDMSLVGPRPMATRDVALFPDPWLMRRFSAPPGLTCLWQIRGRSELTFDEWIALDLQYIDNWSLWLDLTILFRTIPAVVRGTGAM